MTTEITTISDTDISAPTADDLFAFVEQAEERLEDYDPASEYLTQNHGAEDAFVRRVRARADATIPQIELARAWAAELVGDDFYDWFRDDPKFIQVWLLDALEGMVCHALAQYAFALDDEHEYDDLQE
jgi:hypothetical protein